MLPDKLKKVFCNPKHWNFLNNHVLFVFTFLSIKIYTVSSIVHLSSFAVCMLLAFIPHPILIICGSQLYNTDPPGCQGLKRPYQGWGGSNVARLNFKTSRVGVYKCLSLIVGFAVTVAIWPREVVSCRDFILHTVTTFWARSLVGIYPGRASLKTGKTCRLAMWTIDKGRLYMNSCTSHWVQ